MIDKVHTRCSRVAPIVFASLLTLFGCKHGAIGPDEGGSYPSGRRDYLWKVDTLQIDPFQYLQGLWGTSPNDVWAVGTAGIWHFDGTSWSQVGHFSGLNLSTIFGISRSDAWIGTSPGGTIYRYNGSQWNTFGDYHLQGFSLCYINSIWGSSSTNVYAVGCVGNPNTSGRGTILKFDGTTCSYMRIPNISVSFNKIVKATNESGNYYLWGEEVLYDTTTNPVTILGFVEKAYEYDGSTSVREIFSSTAETRIPYEAGGKVYFTSGGHSVWKWTNNSFVEWYYNSDYSMGLTFGRSENDLFFWSGYQGSFSPLILAHYNGSDISPLYKARAFWGCTVFNNDVFIIIDGDVRGIARGTLGSH